MLITDVTTRERRKHHAQYSIYLIHEDPNLVQYHCIRITCRPCCCLWQQYWEHYEWIRNNCHYGRDDPNY